MIDTISYAKITPWNCHNYSNQELLRATRTNNIHIMNVS